MNTSLSTLEKLVNRMESARQKAALKRGDMLNPDALTTPAPALEIIPAKPAAQSGGPRSPEGKAIARLNATRHGLLSEVIPTHEADTYATHLASVRDHYQPLGYLEEQLTERVAVTLWRMARLERYETTVVARDTAQAFAALRSLKGSRDPRDIPRARDALRNTLEEIRAGLEAHALGPHTLASEPPARLRAWAHGFSHLMHYDNFGKHQRFTRKLERKLNLPRGTEWFEAEDDAWTFETAAFAVEGFTRLEEHGPYVDGLLRDWDRYAARLGLELERAEAELERVARLEAHTHALASVPHPATLEKLQKYEAHLSRQLYKAMHELEAMQDRRNGKAAPLARLEIHGMPEE